MAILHLQMWALIIVAALIGAWIGWTMRHAATRATVAALEADRDDARRRLADLSEI